MKAFPILSAFLFGMLFTSPAADTKPAASAINALGVDLYRTRAKGDANLLLSPYSIQTALAMTYAGADGETRAEMQRVLHFIPDENDLHGRFAALGLALKQISADSAVRVKQSSQRGGPTTPIEFHVANRLFAQKQFELRPTFLNLVQLRYFASAEKLDFKDADASRTRINRWIEQQTRQKIRDLIPTGALTGDLRLVVVNALYLRAPWGDQFSKDLTKPVPFHVEGGTPVPVPTMSCVSDCGFADRQGFKVITRPYDGRTLQFVIFLPDKVDGLPEIERALTPKLLADCARLPVREVSLHLPKFRIEPPTIQLADALKTLGMKTAFDEPKGSANFDRMAPRKPNGYLYISKVLHKTFLALDEEGTEAAAATAVSMGFALAAPPPKPEPIEVRVDRSFIFAIQHVESGACLFLGRVVDPR